MQWEIIYEIEGTKDKWGDKPGRLWIPVPRAPHEVTEAVTQILKKPKLKRIIIVPVNGDDS